MRRALLLACMCLAACGRGERRAVSISHQDDWGRTVELAAPAQRIVSLAPATTELVFGLGLGPRLVGRTTWCDYPAEARAVTDVGNGLQPSIEAVAAVRPDLVLLYASESNRSSLARFEALRIPVAVIKLDNAEELRRAALGVARLAGAAGAGDSLVGVFDRELANVARAGQAAVDATGLRPSVYIDIEGNPPITIGKASFLTQIVELAGARNAFDDIDAPSAPVSLETIVARPIDVVLVLSNAPAAAEAPMRRPGWRAVRAVRSGHIILADPSLYGRPSPRMPQAVFDLLGKLAPYRHRPATGATTR